MEEANGSPSRTAGAWRLLRSITSDARGEVHEAVHSRTGERVALRMLVPAAAQWTPEDRTWADEQMQAATRLRHPNIVALEEFGWDEGVPWLATELVHGETLTQYLARVGRLPVLQAFALVMQLLSALQAGAALGLVHGGLNPDHLLVDRNGRLKVDGYGWARLAKALATSQPPPDGARAAIAEGLGSDLFSAAEVAYELFTGVAPFPRPGLHKPASAPSARAVRPHLPAPVDAALQRALALDPAQRFADAREFGSALQAAVGLPVWAAPASAPSPAASAPAPQAAKQEDARATAVQHGHRSKRRWAGVALACTGAALAAWIAAVVASGSGTLAGSAAMGPGVNVQQQVQEVHPPPHLPEPSGTDTAATSPPAAKAVPASTPAGEAPGLRDGLETEAPTEAAPAPATRTQPPARRPPAAQRSKPSESESRESAAKPTLAQRQVVAARQRPGEAPALGCNQDLHMTREICRAFRCALPRFWDHPICVRMHAEARPKHDLIRGNGGP